MTKKILLAVLFSIPGSAMAYTLQASGTSTVCADSACYYAKQAAEENADKACRAGDSTSQLSTLRQKEQTWQQPRSGEYECRVTVYYTCR